MKNKLKFLVFIGFIIQCASKFRRKKITWFKNKRQTIFNFQTHRQQMIQQKILQNFQPTKKFHLQIKMKLMDQK